MASRIGCNWGVPGEPIRAAMLALPQHHIWPLSTSPHVCMSPAEILLNVRLPKTRSGSVTIKPVDPFPNWPAKPVPQHQTEPAAVRAQVCKPPAEICAKVIDVEVSD